MDKDYYYSIWIYGFNCGCSYIPCLIGIEWLTRCPLHPLEWQLKLPFKEAEC